MGGSIAEKNLDEEYSEIGDGGDVGFLDFEDDKSFNSFNPSDAGPVSISIPFRFAQGKPQSAFVGETSADSIRIQNNTDEPIDLWSIQIFSSNPEDSFVLSLMKPPSANADKRESNAFVGSYALEDRVLQPRQTLNIWLSCKPKEIGLQTSVVHFDVGYEKIERVAFLLADNNVSQTLFSTRPYSRAPIRGKIFDCNNYVTGPRPTRPSRPSTGFRLHQYEIPKEIRELVEARQVPDVVMEGLNAFNYARFFSALINIEEIHLEEQMRAFDMQSVCLKRRASQYLSLEVPGLAEKRPSLVCGDFIFAKLANQDPDRISHPFQGFIHRVEADEILLKFDKNLHQFHRDDHPYNISFTYNRLNMRKLYHAITAAECLGKNLLFPLQSAKQRVISTTPFQPSTPSLNREQIQSVEMIMGCKGFPPYVIHGPPGTGKTLTVVEAILQLYRARKKARILVCAASNFAADHVMEKLLAGNMFGIRESEIFRLNAASRQREDVRPDFIKYCYFDDSSFQCPPLKALQRYRIIISTYMSSASLHAEGIRRGHFSHIFLDEAAQVSEPEAMNPIATLSTYDTVIVLAGDPMQLGPVVYSSTAEELGLGKSYMERLFEFEYYNGGDENYVTKLLRNYRCHPAILELPSKLFYTGELIACKDDDESSLYDCVNLPNKSFPVLFVGIQGCDEREGNNPSWFNRFEASKVVDFTKNLLSNDELSEADIGVITPYKQQVTKIQKALEFLEKPDIKVGSVEQFQGQERKIIIISTVRSTVKHNNFDRAYCLGFLHNPRRFNVSITRARSLLIIIGNPHIIAKDPYWEKLLRHCVDNGSYQGCPLPPLDKQGFPQHSSAYSYTRDIEEPKLWGVECREDSQQNFKIAEWCEKASTLCNIKNGYHEGTSTKYNDDDERSEHVGKFDEPDPKFIVTGENYPCYNSNEDELGSTDDYSACKDSLIQQCGFTEAVMGNEMPDLDGGDDKDFVPQNNGFEWKGLTFTATGWD